MSDPELLQGSVEVYVDPEHGTVEVVFKFAIRGMAMDAKAARSFAYTLIDAADRADKKPPVQ